MTSVQITTQYAHRPTRFTFLQDLSQPGERHRVSFRRDVGPSSSEVIAPFPLVAILHSRVGWLGHRSSRAPEHIADIVDAIREGAVRRSKRVAINEPLTKVEEPHVRIGARST